MPLKFDQAHRLATDATLIERTQFCLVAAAVEVIRTTDPRDEATADSRRFAREVLSSSESVARRMTWGIVTHPKIGDGGKDDATVEDDALHAVINDLWSIYAAGA